MVRAAAGSHRRSRPSDPAMMDTRARLVHMANQIARNFEAAGRDRAAAATADHIASFWDPRMKAQLFECRDQADNGLGETATEAVRLLAARRDAASGAPADGR